MSGFQAIAPSLAAGAINSCLLGVGIALVVRVLLWSMAKRHSGVRFALLYSALVGIVSAFWRADSYRLVPDVRSQIALPSHWAVYLVCGWALIAAAGLLRIGIGLVRLRTLRKTFVPLNDGNLSSLLQGRSGRRVSFVVSDAVRVPTAFGFFRPAVVLPGWALKSLSSDELRTAALHELAHIDRWDDWTNLGQKIIRALLFFHPAVWWIDSRLEIEREMSCDDAVLVQSSDPQRYAECLVSIAEKSFLRKQIALAHAAVGHMQQTALRIKRILDGRKRESIPRWRTALASAMVFSLLSGMAAEYTPRLVGFDDVGSPTASVAAARDLHTYQVQVVPAALPMVAAGRRPNHQASSKSKLRATKPVRKPEIQNYMARRNADVAPGPQAINASAPQGQSAHFMFVVFQTREYDVSGGVTVTTTVWRMRVPDNGQASSPVPHST